MAVNYAGDEAALKTGLHVHPKGARPAALQAAGSGVVARTDVFCETFCERRS